MRPRPHLPAYASRRTPRRTVVVAYDVATTTSAGRRRLRAAAAVCEEAGRRLQWSVYECRLTRRELDVLRQTLLGLLDQRTDRLVLILIGVREERAVEEYGPVPGSLGALVAV